MRPGRTQIAWLVALGAALWLGACEASRVASEPSGAAGSQTSAAGGEIPDGDQVTIFVTSNGWHSEIVVPRALLPASAIPEAAAFADAIYLSFGWGDETYYPEPDPTVEMALRAALVPTPAVVHMSGLRAHPSNVFPFDEVVEVKLAQDGFQRLVTYIDASFARDSQDGARQAAPGLYRFSRFYPATGEFHLFNTCNTWTARGLNLAGLPIQVFGTVRAKALMAQVRRVAGPGNAAQPAAEVRTN